MYSLDVIKIFVNCLHQSEVQSVRDYESKMPPIHLIPGHSRNHTALAAHEGGTAEGASVPEPPAARIGGGGRNRGIYDTSKDMTDAVSFDSLFCSTG